MSPTAAPKPTKKTAAAKRLTAKEIAARDARVFQELKDQVAAQAAELAALKEERRRGVANVQAAVDEALADESTHIERPKGSAGDRGFRLRDEMRLDDNPKLYKRIQRTVRRCVDRAGLDAAAGFRGQDTIKLGQVYKAARDLQPYLRRFVKDWATAELVKLLLRNRRQYASRRTRHETPEPETDLP